MGVFRNVWRIPVRTPESRAKQKIARARRLRKTMTEGEKRLWQALQDFRTLYGLHVRKQVPIGPFVADFAILRQSLVIEIDGEHHFTPKGSEKDTRRDALLAELGYRVLRINTGELADNSDGCIATILRELGIG